MSNLPIFTVQDLKYKGILDIPELEVHDSRLTCLVGESGSGKSTLLKIFNHLLSPDQGRVFYRGQDLESCEPLELRRRVIMLPQSALIVSGTVAENLNLGRRYQGIAAADASEMNSVLARVGLEKALDASCEKLSGGERQRLSLARVLPLTPEVLLLDEPFSALDREAEEKLIQLIQEESRTRRFQLIMVTHAEPLAERYASQRIVLSEGRIEEVI